MDIGFQQVISIKSITRNKVRSLATILTVAVSCFVILMIGGYYSFLFQSIQTSQIAALGHITLTPRAGSVDDGATGYIYDYEQLIASLEANEDIALATGYLAISGIVGFGEKSAIFTGEGGDFAKEARMRAAFSLEKGSGKENGAILGRILAENLGVRDGDMVNVLANHGISLEVADSRFEDSPSEELNKMYVKMPLSAAQRALGKNALSGIGILLKDESRLADCSLWIEQDLLDRWNLKMQLWNGEGSTYRSVVTVFSQSYNFIIGVIVITVFFAITSTVTMSIMERSSEIGVIRSFGVRKADVVKLLLNEGFYIGLAGFLSGCLLCFFIALAVNATGGIYIPPLPTTDSGFYAKIVFSLGALGLAFAISIGVSVIASAFASLRILQLDIMEQIRYL